MLGMPKGLTAATGMDALTHAIEAYVSTASTPVTDASALHAIRLVSSYLRTAVLHGDNLEARDMMRYSHTITCLLCAGHLTNRMEPGCQVELLLNPPSPPLQFAALDSSHPPPFHPTSSPLRVLLSWF